MANNEKQSTGLWSTAEHKGEAVWAYFTIGSLMEETGFSIEEGETVKGRECEKEMSFSH